ncbi:MAG: hypothetical protein GC145_00565 [Caulobacter sp.]|nr:hypothetical protein [Caulobacter sp.]
MRILTLSLLGLSALALGACDDLTDRQARADKDCCCANTCPTPAPAPAPTRTAETTPPPAPPAATPAATASARYHRKAARRWTHSAGGSRYVARSGTEGVGYLDEDLAGGYRRVGARSEYRAGTSVSIEESERYSERESRSESGYAYGYSEGYRTDGYSERGGRRGHGRRHYQGYTGVDRDGYLTWPGKTP